MGARPLQRVWFVRHGETPWTVTGQHTGRTDIPLTAHGEDEARKISRRLHDRQFDAVLTSPLQRALRTCELAGFGAVAQVDPNLSEWDYGEYEGRRTSDIQLERPSWRLFEDGCPGGEGVAAVGARADRTIGLVRRFPGDVLVFAHRDILRVFASRWIELAPIEGRRLYLSTGSISIVGYGHDVHEPVIQLWNDVPD
jgi:probable phosphoglycerate mutase